MVKKRPKVASPAPTEELWDAGVASARTILASDGAKKRAASLAPDLVIVVEAQHRAIDWLLARLAIGDRLFLPTQSPAFVPAERGQQLITTIRGS